MTQEQISRPVALGFTDGMTALEGRTSDMTITKCPICEADLQLTEVNEVWFTLTHATVTDGLIERNTDEAGEIWYGEGTTGVTIYCANDHTAEEMAAALKGQEQIS